MIHSNEFRRCFFDEYPDVGAQKHTAPAGAGKFAGYQAVHVSGKLRCPRRGLPLMEEKEAKEDQGLSRGRGIWPDT